MSSAFAILVALAALIHLVNRRWWRWPSTIGLMTGGLLTSLAVIALRPVWPGPYALLGDVVRDADLQTLLMDVLLGFLLFAGALRVDISALRRQQATVLLFATVGVFLSTALCGAGLYGAALWMDVPLSFWDCLVFGALISPTDPVAVLAILEELGVDEALRLKVEGESLFNDGVGVVVFTTVLALHGSAEAAPGPGTVLSTFAEEALGGLDRKRRLLVHEGHRFPPPQGLLFVP
jgi:CPA1 family monovalent cation:H+ antiporter